MGSLGIYGTGTVGSIFTTVTRQKFHSTATAILKIQLACRLLTGSYLDNIMTLDQEAALLEKRFPLLTIANVGFAEEPELLLSCR